MASVSSLDQDMRRLRMDRYTPAAANEARSWIEQTLDEKLPSADLVDSLRDGVALCKLANLALPTPRIKFKASSMPFQQMENISQFLRACEMPPLNMPSHDRFLTVDLYDGKDPAQVLQCLGAFSRAANATNPTRFTHVIGPKRSGSPTKRTAVGDVITQSTGGFLRGRATSNTSQGSEPASSKSPTGGTIRMMSPSLTGGSNSSKATTTTSANGSVRQPKGNISSWSKRSDEGVTAPAWNIAQYGYMGGASQGNQGIMFGAPRQITSAAVAVPSLAEKEKRRKEGEAKAEVKAEARRMQQEEEKRRLQAQREAEVEQARMEEERRWEEQTQRARERERGEIEKQKRRWEEEELHRKEAERLKREDDERSLSEAKAEQEAKKRDSELKGQYSREYQSDQNRRSLFSPTRPPRPDGQQPQQNPESDRIRELERQLQEAKERERQYRPEQEGRARQSETPRSTMSPDRHQQPEESTPEEDTEYSFASGEENFFRHQNPNQEQTPSRTPANPRPLPNPQFGGASSPIHPFNPAQAESKPESPSRGGTGVSWSQADISQYSAPRQSQPNRLDRFLASNPAPETPEAKTHLPAEIGMTSSSERAAEDARRVAGQAQTKAGGWASKSLLEREMERERERQREWEEAQMAKNKATGGSGRVMGPRAMGGR